ncbi:intraflagellar transport protein 46 homolog isoform X2 [Rhopilema esculentum]|uniref:intraflagellar transport protein 46 homolog isoform X2 n=1 Tax=Rhopilema esculentum TaxID=499914 RepID=UPI0031DDAE39
MSNSTDNKTRLVNNQLYDETLSVHDDEEIASTFTPSPRPARIKGPNQNSTEMGDLVSDDEFDHDNLVETSAPQKPSKRGQPIMAQKEKPAVVKAQGEGIPSGRTIQASDDDDDEEDDDENQSDSSDEEEDDEEDEVAKGALEGAYDPAEYEHLPVSQEIKDLFQFITRYTPQNIELEHKLRPFIPDYIPSVGDIDAFLKVTRPENKVEVLGLQVLDEPCAKQSDPTVLDLQLRSISKQTTAKQMVVRSIDDAEKNPKAVDTWIESISDLHKQKPAQNVHYSKTMPDVEGLMQEWPHDFEEMLKTVGLPTAELECDLQQYIDIVCGILDIPVHKSRVQSLHVLFTLYSEFKNSQHFNQLARDNLLSNKLKGNRGAANESEDFQSMTFE